MKKYNVKITGITPILYNRFRDAQIEPKIKKRTTGAQEEEIKNKLYLDADNIPYIPSVYIRNSMIEAAKNFKIVGKGKSNYSRLVGAVVDIMPECIQNNNAWTPFRISAVNPMTHGRMMVSRPLMNKWNLEFEIVVNDDSIDGEVIHEIIEHAGKYVGIGDWRPEKKGKYGKFQIMEFKEVK